MSTLGVIGALAHGYTEAARERREQNLALGEHHRDLTIGLLDKLIADPSTPAEYKDSLLKARVEATNANQYDKNGMLKLPSLDDTLKTLPPIQKQGGPVQAPAIQFPGVPPTGMAPAGPTGPQGGPQASGAALPPSGIQNAPGGPSVPPGLPSALQMPTAPPTLPATPVATPTHTVAEAGQFHVMTPQEQMQHELDVRRSHADALIQQGVSPAQAYVAAGLTPKPELHNIPFLGTAINPYTGQTFGAGAEAERPHGQLQNFQTPNGVVSLQQVQTGDGKFHWEDGAGNAVIPQPDWIKLVPAMLPTQRTNTTSDFAGVKTTSTSTSQKVVPGAKGTGAIKKPAPPPGAASSTSTTKQDNSGLTPQQKRDQHAEEVNAVKLAQKDAVKAASDARTMVNLLQTQKDYVEGLKNGKGQPTPRQDLSLIVAAVRAMNPGSVRLPQKELELELKAGSFGDRLRRQWLNATQGTLPADQREDLFKIVEHETTTTAKNAAKTWKGAMGKQALPAHLTQFDTSAEDEANEYLNSLGGKH